MVCAVPSERLGPLRQCGHRPFFITLECELPDRIRFATHTETRTALFDIVEECCNRWRRHSANGYPSPHEPSRALTTMKTATAGTLRSDSRQSPAAGTGRGGFGRGGGSRPGGREPPGAALVPCRRTGRGRASGGGRPASRRRNGGVQDGGGPAATSNPGRSSVFGSGSDPAAGSDPLRRMAVRRLVGKLDMSAENPESDGVNSEGLRIVVRMWRPSHLIRR